MWNYFKAWTGSIKRPIMIFLCCFSATVIFGSAAVFYLLESSVNPNIKEFLDALYFTVTTLTGVGFGDIVPVTRLGKIFAMANMLLGTAIFVTFSAVIATTLIEIDLEIQSNKDES